MMPSQMTVKIHCSLQKKKKFPNPVEILFVFQINIIFHPHARVISSELINRTNKDQQECSALRYYRKTKNIRHETRRICPIRERGSTNAFGRWFRP